jgi:tryptophan-rich sensory protein
MKKSNWFKLITSLIIPLLAGWIGSLVTMPAIGSWYATLAKPALNPPSWVFAPVWTTLFVLMGIALFIVWKKDWKVQNWFLVSQDKSWNPWTKKFWSGDWQKANIIAIFYIQLVLNVLWSYIFFGLHQPGFAFFELLALWFSILYLIINFYRVSKTAAWLLLPYILWVTFAGYLNWAIWIGN